MEAYVIDTRIAKNVVRRIRPAHGLVPLNLKDLWEYRELLYFLVWRDITVRYKQSTLGMAWAFIQPLLTMIVFTVLFGWLVKVPSDGMPYPVFAYAALLPWQLFSSAVTLSSNSLAANQHLISKVSFPRIIIPVSAVAVSLLDFVVGSVALVGMLALYKVALTVAVFVLPVLALVALTAALGLGLWVSALSVRFRDVRHALPFLIQVGMFATPVVYSASLVAESWRMLYALNPMVGVVEGFRWALLGSGTASGTMLCLSVVLAAALLISGLSFFRQAERTFADMI
ncbi:MAG TPA: ABC transporter permease [Nitrospira sp.]|nr:ABC transporter permease [Nitrospira sp.]